MRYHFIYCPQNYKDRQQQVLVMMWQNWILHLLLVGMWNDTAGLKNSLAVPQKLNTEFPIKPAYPDPKHIPKINKDIRTHKNLYMYIHSRIIYKSKGKKFQVCLSTGEVNNNNNKSTNVSLHYLGIKTNERLQPRQISKMLC